MVVSAQLSTSAINLCENEKEENKKEIAHVKHEVYIGNLKYDLSTRTIIDKLQELCQSVEVTVPDFRFTIFQRKSKRHPIKYGFILLSNEREEKSVQQLDGMENLDIVPSGHKLKVQVKYDISQIGKSDKATVSFQPMATSCRLKKSRSTPSLHSVGSQSQESRISIDSKPYNKAFCYGQLLPSEDRVTEYKRGSGLYLKKSLVPTIRKYICAFLNSEGGHLMIGVDDHCKVYGVCCDREDEDLARCQIDQAIKHFQPHVLPSAYVVDFIPVKLSIHDKIESTTTDSLLKVLEVSVKRPTNANALYENDRGHVFVRRDGSIEGPLKSAQIVEWCRVQFANKQDMREKQEHAIIARESYSTLRKLEKLEDRCELNQKKMEEMLEHFQKNYESKHIRLMEKLDKKELELEKARNDLLAKSRALTFVCSII